MERKYDQIISTVALKEAVRGPEGGRSCEEEGRGVPKISDV
jgi:hypothetical protein